MHGDRRATTTDITADAANERPAATELPAAD
jgi:hypothetical protein